MIDLGKIITDTFPKYGWLLIDISHFVLGYLSKQYWIIIPLFVIYQILDIKKDDHLFRDFLFFGLGYILRHF